MNIDEEISATEDLVLSLRQRHNALVTAVNTPREILCAIFAYWPVELKRNIQIVRPPAWLAILQVCSRWRQTYLSTPTLWSDPGDIWLPELQQYVEVVLERALGAPIDIEFSFNDISCIEKLPEALPAAISWLRSLKFYGQDSKLSKMLRVLNGLPAPRLEALQFDLASDEYDKGHDLRRCHLFAGEPPALKILTLRNCMFSWKWSFLTITTLTQLNIEGHSRGPRPALTDLLAVLSRLPVLEQLRLTNCLPILTQHVEHVHHTRVELQHLRRLKLISNSPLALHAVALHIRVPTSAKFSIRCTNYSFGEQPALDPFHAQLLSDIVIDHVLVDGLNSSPREGIKRVFDQHLAIRGSEEDISPHESFMDFGAMRYHERYNLNAPFDFVRSKQSWESFLQFYITWETDFEPNTPYTPRAHMASFTYGAILNAVPLGGLQVAYLTGDIFRHHTRFALTFRKAINVQALTLAGEIQYHALEAMSGLIDIDSSLTDQLLFPSLKRLCLCITLAHTVLSDGRTAIRHLRAMLRRRRDADQNAVGGLRMLDRLGLFCSAIPDAQARGLGPLVRHGSADVIRADEDSDLEGDT